VRKVLMGGTGEVADGLGESGGERGSVLFPLYLSLFSGVWGGERLRERRKRKMADDGGGL
jgi:hypothetical protein